MSVVIAARRRVSHSDCQSGGGSPRKVAGVSGKLQSQHNVVHLVVERFWELQLGAVAPARASRDFH